MANELKHGSVGTELTQAEWEGVGTHVFDSQATGDIPYASSASQLSRLAISATATHFLGITGGVPAWKAVTVAGSDLTGTSLASGIVSSSLTSVGTLTDLTVSGTSTTIGTVTSGIWQGTAIAAAYVATLNQDTTGTATNATHVTVTDNESTNESDLIPFIENASATGNVGLESDGDFHYNPSTGTVTATIFAGALSGNSTTATALATARTINGVSFDGSANVTVTAAASTLTGTALPSGVVTSSLTTVGTIGTGVWQGTDVGVAHGGTGASTLTANGVLIGNGTGAVTAVDQSTKGHILVGDGSGNPQMLAVGSNDQVLTADSGETTGVKWAAAAGGGGGDYESTIGAGGSTSLTGSKRYIIAPGTTMTGAVTLSNANTHLRIGAGVDFDGNVLTLSGAGCSVVCEDGVTLDGVVMSGTMCSFDGGGWKTKSNGGTSRHGFSVTNNECMVSNMTLQTTGGGGTTYDAFNGNADSDQLTVFNLYIEDSDGVGMDCRGNQTRIYGCWIGLSDEEGIYTAGNRCVINGNNVQEPSGNGIGADGDDCTITGNIVRKGSETGGSTVNLGSGSNDHVVVGNRLGGAVNDSSSSSTITGNDTDTLT